MKITVYTDKVVEVPGAGLFGPEPEEVFNDADEVVLVPVILTEPQAFTKELTDAEIGVWEAVNQRKFPSQGLIIGGPAPVGQSDTPAQGELEFNDLKGDD
jgi:hypothetical protein